MDYTLLIPLVDFPCLPCLTGLNFRIRKSVKESVLSRHAKGRTGVGPFFCDLQTAHLPDGKLVGELKLSGIDTYRACQSRKHSFEGFGSESQRVWRPQQGRKLIGRSGLKLPL
jgi:hypothetical protein